MRRCFLFTFILWVIAQSLTIQGQESNVFTASAIPDSIFERMLGKSYPQGCEVPRENLRYLRVAHYDLEGIERVGEMVCNKAIAEDLLDIFRILHQSHYPIEQMRLIDDYGADDDLSMSANNSSCFCYRTIAGTARLSRHSLGMAVDINPLYNPYVRTVNGKSRIAPKKGERYADRTLDYPYKITCDDLCTSLFLQHGFRWGGNWTNPKDYQHFEK